MKSAIYRFYEIYCGFNDAMNYKFDQSGRS